MDIKLVDAKELKQAYKRLSKMDHPKRIEIIKLLMKNKEMNVTQVYVKLKIAQPEASHHLRLLYTSGAINKKRSGKEIYYFLNIDGYKHLLNCIDMLNK